MTPFHPSHFVILALLAWGSPAQDGVRWWTDLRPALQAAADAKKPVLLLFTVGDLCPTCEKLETVVFARPEYAAGPGQEYVHVRLVYAGAEGGHRSRQILAASARLRGYPTLYLLDASGWPYFVLHGYAGESVGEITAQLTAARADARRPAELRAQGEKGQRELLAWYRQADIRLGETLAAGALYPAAAAREQANLAPLLIGAAAAKDGFPGAQAFFPVLTAEDPDGARGFHAAALEAAGSQLLRAGEFAAAARCFQRLVALAKAAAEPRMNAELSLGYAYRKLGAPCLAREHYARCAELARALAGPCAARVLEHALEQLAMVPACEPGACGCAAKRVCGH